MQQQSSKSKDRQAILKDIQLINKQFFKAAGLLSNLELGKRHMVTLLGEQKQCVTILNKLQAQQLKFIFNKEKLSIQVQPINIKERDSFLELTNSSNKQIIFHSLQNIIPANEILQTKDTKLLLKKIIFYEILKLCDKVAFYIVINFDSEELDQQDVKLISDSYTQLCENFKSQDGYNILLQINFLQIQEIKKQLHAFLIEKLQKCFTKDVNDDKIEVNGDKKDVNSVQGNVNDFQRQKIKNQKQIKDKIIREQLHERFIMIKNRILKEDQIILQQLHEKFIMSQKQEENITQFFKQYLICHQNTQSRLRKQFPTYFLPQDIKIKQNKKQLLDYFWGQQSNVLIWKWSQRYRKITTQLKIKFVENIQKYKTEFEESQKDKNACEYNIKILNKICSCLKKSENEFSKRQILPNNLIFVVKKITLPIFNQKAKQWRLDLQYNLNQKQLSDFDLKAFNEAQQRLKKILKQSQFQQKSPKFQQYMINILNILRLLFTEKKDDYFNNIRQTYQLKLLEDLISSIYLIDNNQKMKNIELKTYQNIIFNGFQILNIFQHLRHSNKLQIQEDSQQCQICDIYLKEANFQMIQKKIKYIFDLSQISNTEFTLTEEDLRCEDKFQTIMKTLGSLKNFKDQDLNYFKNILTFKVANPLEKGLFKYITDKVKQLQFFFPKCSKILIFLNLIIIFNMKIIQIESKGSNSLESNKYQKLKNKIYNLFNEPAHLDFKKKLKKYTKLQNNINAITLQTMKIFNQCVKFVLQEQFSKKLKKKYKICITFIKIFLKSQRKHQKKSNYFEYINEYEHKTTNQIIYSIMCKIQLFLENVSDFQKYYDLAIQKKSFQTYNQLQVLIKQLGLLNQTALQQKVRNYIIFKKAAPQQSLSKLIQRLQVIKKQGKKQDRINFRLTQKLFLQKFIQNFVIKVNDPHQAWRVKQIQAWRVKQIVQKCNQIFFNIREPIQPSLNSSLPWENIEL